MRKMHFFLNVIWMYGYLSLIDSAESRHAANLDSTNNLFVIVLAYVCEYKKDAWNLEEEYAIWLW